MKIHDLLFVSKTGEEIRYSVALIKLLVRAVHEASGYKNCFENVDFM